MKVLCTSDWHMGIYGDPSDAVKLTNDELLDLLAKWESEYDYILLNGDIFETLKSSRIKFSHFDQARRVLDDRAPLVERFLASDKYLWIAGNHDYALEEILGLPLEIKVELDHGFTLVAEHGHLLRAPKEHYSSYAWHFHLMYCLTWWIDKLGMTLWNRNFCLDTSIALELDNYWSQKKAGRWHHKLKKKIISLAFAYASLNSDQGYASLNDIFLRSAQSQFQEKNTIVVFGHSHFRQIKCFDNNNMYLNAGHFCMQNQYSFLALSTDAGTVRAVSHHY